LQSGNPNITFGTSQLISFAGAMVARPFLPFLVLGLGVMPCRSQLLPSFGDSRTGTTGFQFLKIAPDARSAGLAEGIIVLTDDPTAVFWNPAGITRVDTHAVHIAAGYTQYFAGMSLNHLSLVRRIKGETYMGLGLLYFDSGDMPVTTEFLPTGNGQMFRAVDFALGATVAGVLTSNLSFGGTTRFVREGIAGISTNALVFDFGFQYDVGLADIRFAVTINNFGFNARPHGSIEKTTLQGTTTVTDFEQVVAPGVFRIGVAWDPVKTSTHHLTLVSQLNHPTDNNETVGLGAEYWWKRLLALRTGYLLGVDEKGLPSFGFGLRLPWRIGGILLDYGFAAKNRLGPTHRLTLGLSLG
jgi:hypothetical protein